MTRHRTDIAILGGGIIGWSLAWHLKKSKPALGVLVIDPTPDQASILRGTGGARSQFATEVNIRLSLKSLGALRRFSEETGYDIDWTPSGYLMVSAREERLDLLRRYAAMQNRLGGRTKVLGPDELEPWQSVLRTDDLVGATFSSLDGLFHGPKLLVGLMESAMKSGVRTLKRSVTGLGEGGLATDDGEIACRAAVVAAGHGSWALAKLLGVRLNLVSERHQLYRVAPADRLGIEWPESLPMVVDADTSFHFRRRDTELLLGFDDPAIRVEEKEPQAQPEFDPSGIERMCQAAAIRSPQLSLQPDQVEGWAGWYTRTPDGAPIVDWVKPSILALVGLGGHGGMHSLALGEWGAKMILEGQPGPAEFRFKRGKSAEEAELKL
ncbi:MAG TPA: FAD-dependent oxidoreductase [Fimbriimonadaceae bacterium]|nr:FAD-dependent oxidoreductase [Fimbriimonadaceae bacterium]HRJ32326.1 FAD-dependent oxidoreductase [Fimbriimonadaceae bacterium]